MFERFTTQARAVVLGAQEEAARLHAGHVGTEHLLLGIVRDEGGATARLLARLGLGAAAARAAVEAHAGEPGLDAGALATLGIDLDEVRERVERAFGVGALARGTPAAGGRSAAGARPPFSPAAKKALELALREALALGDRHIGAEHVLLGILREGEGLAARVLCARGIDRAAVLEAMSPRTAG